MNLNDNGIKLEAWHYFDDMIKFEDFNNILLDEKSYGNIFIYDISYKTLIITKPLRIIFDKDGFIRDYDGTEYLVLFDFEIYDDIHDRIIYLIGLKGSITYVFSHHYAKINIDSGDDWSLEKTLNLHNIMMLIKSVVNQNQNHSHYNILLKNVLINQLKNDNKNIFDSTIMLRFSQTKVTKEKCFSAKKTIKYWDGDVNDIVISKLVETKDNCSYLIGCIDKVIRLLVLILSKMSGHVKTLKIKDGEKDEGNKLQPFRIDDENMLLYMIQTMAYML